MRDREQKINLLIVDDDENMVFLLEEMLKTNGYNVITAFSAEEALEKMKHIKPHIILSDIMMPGMDGFEFCRKVRNDKKLSDVEFIFLTAKEASEFETTGLKLGADDFIEKPFSFDRLLARIEARKRRVLQRKQEGEISGRIGDWNLMDVLQVLEMGRKTGRINITTPEREAQIDIKDGEIVNAVFGNKKGKKALEEILSLKEGEFVFDSTEKIKGKKTIKVSSMLLEMAKGMDEENESQKRKKLIVKLKKEIWEK